MTTTNLRGPLPGGRRARGELEASDLPPLVPPKASFHVPRTPKSLGPAGRRVWREVWRSIGWLDATAHLFLVEQLCHLADEVVIYRQALAEHGALIESPIQTASGRVVGTRREANPASEQLRKAISQIESILKSLGGTPEARARLGVVAAGRNAE